MIAVSDKVQERTLDFRTNSLIGFDSAWAITQGTGSINANSIDLNTNSTVALTLSNVTKKMTYIKILCNITASDHTLNTQYSKNVAVIYKITYTDNSIPDTTDIFYPNFDFEENSENYTIVELSGDKISSINIQIINSEETSISITDLGLFYILEIDNNNLNEELQDSYTQDPSYINDIIDQYMEDHPTPSSLTIPLVNSLPPLNTVPDGYICRLN